MKMCIYFVLIAKLDNNFNGLRSYSYHVTRVNYWLHLTRIAEGYKTSQLRAL